VLRFKTMGRSKKGKKRTANTKGASHPSKKVEAAPEPPKPLLLGDNTALSSVYNASKSIHAALLQLNVALKQGFSAPVESGNDGSEATDLPMKD